MSAVFAVVDPKGAERAVRQLRGLMFPEEAVSDAEYLRKAKQMFYKMRDIDLRIKPFPKR